MLYTSLIDVPKINDAKIDSRNPPPANGFIGSTRIINPETRI